METPGHLPLARRFFHGHFATKLDGKKLSYSNVSAGQLSQQFSNGTSMWTLSSGELNVLEVKFDQQEHIAGAW